MGTPHNPFSPLSALAVLPPPALPLSHMCDAYAMWCDRITLYPASQLQV
jgi:hypothetical protein